MIEFDTDTGERETPAYLFGRQSLKSILRVCVCVFVCVLLSPSNNNNTVELPLMLSRKKAIEKTHVQQPKLYRL